MQRTHLLLQLVSVSLADISAIDPETSCLEMWTKVAEKDILLPNGIILLLYERNSVLTPWVPTITPML